MRPFLPMSAFWKMAGGSPWERIRALKARTSTPLAMALRGRFLVGSRPVDADVVRRFVSSAAANGIEIFRLHDREALIVSLYAPSGSAGPERQASKDRFLEFFLPRLLEWARSGRETVLVIEDEPALLLLACGILEERGYTVLRALHGREALTHLRSTADTCIIVLEITADGEATIVGAVADSVQEVLELEAERIEPPPRIGMRLKTEFIRGMGNLDERFLIILDIDRIFSTDELALVQEAGEEAAALPA